VKTCKETWKQRICTNICKKSKPGNITNLYINCSSKSISSARNIRSWRPIWLIRQWTTEIVRQTLHQLSMMLQLSCKSLTHAKQLHEIYSFRINQFCSLLVINATVTELCTNLINQFVTQTDTNKQCGHRVRPTRYAPPICNPDLWPFDLETGVRVASKVGNLNPNLGTLGLWVLELFAMYTTDRQTNRRTDKSNAYCPLPYGRGHNKSVLPRWPTQ